MVALVYVSTATQLFTLPELRELLAVSRENNAQLGITGALLYNDGNFIQALEGDPIKVAKLYRTIRADPRHHHVTPLIELPEQERVFADWTMAFCDLHEPIMQAAPGYAVLSKLTWYSPTLPEQPSLIFKLLRSFASHNH